VAEVMEEAAAVIRVTVVMEVTAPVIRVTVVTEVEVGYYNDSK
jgi:hypothetical protein